MKEYERHVRGLIKSIDDFFSSKGMNAVELYRNIEWLKAYHKRQDEERREKGQLKLF